MQADLHNFSVLFRAAVGYDVSMKTDDEILALLRSRVDRSTQESVAGDCGVSQAMISAVLRGVKPMPPRIAAALGYERVTMWRKVRKGKE